MAQFLWICLGGAVGTACRYLLAGWVTFRLGAAFPFGTLSVNLIGSFLLGAIMQLSLATGALSPTLRLTLTTGVMGGFTTYSTFNYETLRYFEEGFWFVSVANVTVTVLACLAAGKAGIELVNLMLKSA